MAAPSPDIIPAMRPFDNVREMHNTFTGPTGAEMASPASTPLINSSISLIERHFASRHSIIPGELALPCSKLLPTPDRDDARADAAAPPLAPARVYARAAGSAWRAPTIPHRAESQPAYPRPPRSRSQT